MGLNPIQAEHFEYREAKQVTLRVNHTSSIAFDVWIVAITKHTQTEMKITTVADRAMYSVTQRLDDYPTAICISRRNTVARRGECYISAYLEFGFSHVIMLCAGYLETGKALHWPPAKSEGSVEGPGKLRSITGTDPAAGSNSVETVPTNARWRLLSFQIALTTSADVGDRRVHLCIDDGTNELVRWVAASTQAASLTNRYYGESGVGAEHGVRGDIQVLAWPSDLLLFQGWRIRTATGGMFAADDYSAPQIMVEEWIED